MNPASAAASERTEATRPPRRVLRRILIASGVLLALLIIAALSSPWWFNARRVADLALTQADSATGLDWSYEGEPALRWRPQPWLSLPGVRARDARGGIVLTVERIEVAVPWSTLRGESLQIDALRLVAPDVDLDAAVVWWNAQPSQAEIALPQIDGVAVTRGRVRWGSGVLTDMELTLPHFAIGEAMALDLRGVLRRTVPDAATEPFDIVLSFKATPRSEPLRLEAFALGLSGTGPVPKLKATGRLQFSPWRLDASGDIASWPSTWPALPPPLSESRAPIVFSLTQQGESALAAEASLTLARDDVRLEARGVPDEVLSWVDDGDAAALPPLSGRATLPAVELDGVRLEGVTVELDDIRLDKPR